jgi:hypothetical protein
MESKRHVFGLESDVELWQKHLFMLQKSKEPMHAQMHDFIDEDNDNDDPPLAKICKFQLPSRL